MRCGLNGGECKRCGRWDGMLIDERGREDDEEEEEGACQGNCVEEEGGGGKEGVRETTKAPSSLVWSGLVPMTTTPPPTTNTNTMISPHRQLVPRYMYTPSITEHSCLLLSILVVF